MKSFYRFFFACLALCIQIKNVSLCATDNLEVSLLTCSPGKEVYALYGHTALRCRNLSTDEDYVFNYGLFSFNQADFALRFALGECDYMVGMTTFPLFCREYIDRGSFIIQQVLNLSSEEKEALVLRLAENCLPANRTYRYNFLDNNCTTRVRDQVELAVNGTVCYPQAETSMTYRQIMHRYTVYHPWAELGNDLCLGCGVDTLLSERAQLFVPFFLEEAYAATVIRSQSGEERPLVLRTELLGSSGNLGSTDAGTDSCVTTVLLSPVVLSWLLVVLVLGLALLQIRRRTIYWGVDAVLMTATGLAGCIIAFLFFFSEHPSVDTNWQLWVLNPLPLLAMPWVLYCARTGRKTGYHRLNCAILTLFILFSAFIPQDFSVLVVPLATVLSVRSTGYLIHYRCKW